MERSYEKYAAQVDFLLTSFSDEVKKYQDSANKLMGDHRFSPEGKAEAKKAMFAELWEVADNETALLKEAAKQFCNEYRIKLPSDPEDRTLEIANALKVVEMLGYKLTVETLKNILDPLKNSYKHMKMIADVIKAKGTGISAEGVGYDSAVIDTLNEYMGLNTKVFDYLDLFGQIEEIITSANIKLHFVVYPISDTVLELHADVPYRLIALKDNMIAAGKKYAELEDEFSDLFTAHVPTDTEMILNSLK